MSIWRTGVTHAALAAAALLLGLILGGLGPRAELRAVRTAAPAASAPRNAGAQVARLFQGRPVSASAGRDPVPSPRDDTDPGAAPSGDTDPPRPMSPENLDTLRSAMAIRLAGARAALAEDADPSEDQQAEIDSLFGAMNEDLRKIATDLAALDREPTRRDMERFAADTLDILITTEERFDEILTPEQRAALADESRDPLSYVDPSIVDILKDADL